MNAILFNRDGTTRTIENVKPATYLDVPVYVDPVAHVKWQQDGRLPCAIQGTWNRKRYTKQVESADYAVFVEV